MIALYVSILITTVQSDDGVLAETCCLYINYNQGWCNKCYPYNCERRYFHTLKVDITVEWNI